MELGDAVLSEDCILPLSVSHMNLIYLISIIMISRISKIFKFHDLFIFLETKRLSKIRLDYRVLFLHWSHASIPASKYEADLVDSWDLGMTAMLLFLYDCTELLTMYELEKTRDIISTERIRVSISLPVSERKKARRRVRLLDVDFASKSSHYKIS